MTAPDRAASTPVLWLYAVLTGLLAVAVTSGFRALIGGVEWLSTGHTGSLVEAARLLPPWKRALIGTVGGVLAGLAHVFTLPAADEARDVWLRLASTSTHRLAARALPLAVSTA